MQARRGGSGARGEAVGALGAHAPLLERAGRVLLGGGGVRHWPRGFPPCKRWRGGLRSRTSSLRRLFLLFCFQDLGPWWAPSAFAGRGGVPEEVQASVRPREGARGHSRPILYWMGGLLGPLFLTEGPAPTTFVEDEQQLGGRAGPEQGQGRGRAVRGRARAVRASRQEAAPVVHAPGCAHHRPALHPCSRLQRWWCPRNSRQGESPPGACSCARRGS